MELKGNTCFLYIVDIRPPSGIRAFELSKRLIENNIVPTIITKDIHKNKLENYPFLREIPPSLKIFASKTLNFKNKHLFLLFDYFFRFDFYIEWLPFAYFKAKEILKKNEKIKFIYSTGPYFNNHILAYLLKKKFKIPLVLEYRDPWSFSPYYVRHKLFFNKIIDYFIEKKILKNADLIITVSPALTDFLQKKFPILNTKTKYSIANGLNIKKKSIFVEKKPNHEIYFLFAGSLYQKRNIIPLLSIIALLKKENFFKSIFFKLKIFGNYNKILLENIINKLKIEELIYLGDFISQQDVLKEIYNCDLAVHIGENLNYPTISFKVWEYLSCRKKMIYLGCEESYTAKFLQENNLGIVLPINNLSKGKNILKNLILEINNNNFNNNIDEEVLSKYSWDKKIIEFKNLVINNKILKVK